MRAVLRRLLLDPDPRQLPADPAEFSLLARLFVGPSDEPGEESFDVEVCSPEWIARRCSAEGFVDGRHTVITSVETFTEDGLHSFLTRRVESVTGDTWDEVAEKVARLGLWEFEDYTV
jgi:hypothetical protein